MITDEHRRVARQFGQEFFDGDRLFGYGGYRYHPRFWQETVARFRDYYSLPDDAAILDVGCGKGFMLHDFRELMPRATLAGIDISQYAYDQAMPAVKPLMRVGCATQLPYADRSFDLVISINTIHNLPLAECKQALREIERVSRGRRFITVDAWRSDEERQRLMKWILTALTYMHVDDWKRPRYASWFEQGRLPLGELITREYPLEDINEALTDMEQGRLSRALTNMAPAQIKSGC